MRVHCGEGTAIHTDLKSCVRRREARHQALTEGYAGQLLSPESTLPGRRRRYPQVEGDTRGCDNARVRQRERPSGPAGPETPACIHAPCTGTGISVGWPKGKAVRIGKTSVFVADDERLTEVRLLRSSDEAGEQTRGSGCGAGGAKAAGRGKHERVSHVPDAEPGERVPGTLACTRTSKAQQEGTVHEPSASRGHRSAESSVPRASAQGGCWSRWRHVGAVRGSPKRTLRICTSAHIAARSYYGDPQMTGGIILA